MPEHPDHTRPTLIPRIVRVISTPRTVFWEVQSVSRGFGLLPVWLALEFLAQRPLEWVHAALLVQRSLWMAILKLGRSYLDYGIVPMVAIFCAGMVLLIAFKAAGRVRLDLWTAASVVAFAWIPHVLVVTIAALLNALSVAHPTLDAIMRGAISGGQVDPLAVIIEFGPTILWVSLAVQTVFSDEPKLTSTRRGFPRATGAAMLSLVLVTLGVVGYRTTETWETARPLMLNDKVAPLVAKGLGGSVKRCNWKNRVSVLEFWSSSQAAYVAGLGDRERLHRAYQAQGLQILTVNVGESEPTVREALAQRRLKLAVLLDTTGDIRRRFDVTILPCTFLIDTKGRLRGVYVGEFSAERLHAEIRKLLDE